MWGTHPDVESLPARGPRREERAEGRGPRAEEPESAFLVVGDTPLEVASLEALLAPLGQPVLKAFPWSEELTVLLEEDLACIAGWPSTSRAASCPCWRASSVTSLPTWELVSVPARRTYRGGKDVARLPVHGDVNVFS